MNTRSFAFEIGTEELPAFDLHAAVQQLAPLTERVLDERAIPHGEIAVYSTPRRLVACVNDMPEATEEKREVFKGPSVKIAFDEQGNPTKAAQGFARGKGINASDLAVKKVNGTEYVFAETFTPALSVLNLLPDVLEAIVRGITWPKSQRWGSETEYFSRPIRWFVALFGNDVIPFEFAGLTAGRYTYGHRFLAPGPFEVAGADDLLSVVRNAFVVPSEEEREALIRKGVATAEEQTGCTSVLPAKTLLEVVNLCEYPTVLTAQFDEAFLAVPQEIIVDAMLMHQRYFPLYTKQGQLSNSFLVVSNGNPEYAANVIDGNERVVRARLFDAKFFYDEDLKQPLESFVNHLSDVVFQEQLGSMLDKTNRIETLVAHLSKEAYLSPDDASDALRAAHLCKADLVSEAVVEFTSVQGIMGSYYARAKGESEQVCVAIREHYQPRFAGDSLPTTVVGQLVACADKLDTIGGLFAIGQGPTGSSDPFSLRRSAIGIINMLLAGLPVSLNDAVQAALSNYKQLTFDTKDVQQEVMNFFVMRTKVMLKDAGNKPDSIEAVLDCGVTEPAEIALRVQALEKVRAEMPDAMQDLATAFARANNLRDAAAGNTVKESLLTLPEETLCAAIDTARSKVTSALDAGSYEEALLALAQLRGPIDTFFEDVLIMDENPEVRNNRLALLNNFVDVFANIANFAKMAAK